MNLLTVLTWFLFIWQASDLVESKKNDPVAAHHPFIINGTRAERGEFPFLAALFDRGRFICSGSIINQHWILTAAHCVTSHNNTHRYVLVNTINISEGDRYKVVKRVCHNYNPRTFENDICLLRVNEPFTFTTTVQKIQPNPNDIPLNVNTKVVGFGTIHPRYSFFGVLYSTNVTVTSCSDPERPGYNNFICALNRDTGPCYGDSGGPLVYNNTIIGIVSHGRNPCAGGHPDVYVRVSKYIKWITSHARQP